MTTKSIIKFLGDTATRAATLGNDPKILATRVIPTLLAAVTNNPIAKAFGAKSSGVSSNTGVPILDNALSAAASSPFTTALGVASAANPAAAFSTLKNAASPVLTAISGSSGKSKIILATGAIVGANVLATSNVARKAVSKALDNPIGELSQFGADIGRLVDNPSVSSAQSLIANSPILAPLAAIAAGGGLLKAIPAIAGAVATSANTRAIKDSINSSMGISLPSGGITTASLVPTDVLQAQDGLAPPSSDSSKGSPAPETLPISAAPSPSSNTNNYYCGLPERKVYKRSRKGCGCVKVKRPNRRRC